MRSLGVLLVMALGAPVAAAPAADLVVVWAPGQRTKPVEDAARAAGAAALDRSPPAAGSSANAQTLRKAIDAFDRGELDDALKLLDQIHVDTDGGDGLSHAQLSDVFLFRALVKTQQGDANAAWEELVVASAIAPTRELDPGRFPPTVRSEFERARDTVKKRTEAELTINTDAGCHVAIDASTVNGSVKLRAGRHFYRVTCPDRQSQGGRLELAGSTSFEVHPQPFAPPSDVELLELARRGGARAFVVAEVHTNVATARLVGLDGRERDRRTVSIKSDLEPLAKAVAQLLAPEAVPHWYHSKWVWASGGALAAAIVAIPLTAYFTRDTSSADWTLKVPNPPGWTQ